MAGTPSGVDLDAIDVLMEQGQASRQAYENLEVLCDDIGARFSGTPALDEAITWSSGVMTQAGLTNVHTEPVMVPAWVRGEEHASVVSPQPWKLSMLGLGGSVGTPPEGLTAEVLVVSSFDELEQRKAEAQDRIVLFDVPFSGYKETVPYRTGGAIAAARAGAVAALVRSVTPSSLDTPHTGAMRYEEDVRKIPTAAITVENATRIHRMTERGKVVTIHLTMSAHYAPDAPSANVIGEILGRKKPKEIVLLACHLDSWDVGQGAQDDGAGCVAVIEAARLIGELKRPPRRTVRVVLFTNEENGLRGAKNYAEVHKEEMALHKAAIEADTGAGEPLGFRVQRAKDETGSDALFLQDLAEVLKPLGASTLRPGYAGADIRPISQAHGGVWAFGLDMDMQGYWPIHHTAADTLEKIDPAVLAKNATLLSVMAYALADVRTFEPKQENSP